MAKKQQQNKIGESFEQHLPEELVPDFIWDNISNTLDNNLTPSESSEKIKTSFEEGFNEDALPLFLWQDIQSSLDQTKAAQLAENSNNKIKNSFEGGHTDALPEELWENVENQLEIEGVWKRVLKGLNKRTRRRYWQEKGMQLGIVALAVLLLRGCDFGEWTNPTPLAQQSNNTTKIKLPQQKQPSSVTTPLLNYSKNPVTRTDNSNPESFAYTATSLDKSDNSSKNKTLGKQAAKSLPVVRVSKTAVVKKANHLMVNQEVLTNTTNVVAAAENEDVLNREITEIPKPAKKSTIVADNWSVLNPINSASLTPKQSINLFFGGIPTIQTTPLDITKMPFEHSKNTYAQNAYPTVLEQPKKLLSQTAISTLIGQPLGDSSIQDLHDFEINTVVNRKRHHIRFELGMNGKIGTSLFLGDATHKALETTSMVKTEMRTVGGVGIILGCHLTANDAIVLGAYPFSNSQQYFGGYTNEGRYYHKEVKLTYFDFTLGYQRTLFHYNDFGTVPSSMYARVDYGLGYLNKSEEIINGLSMEMGDSYNKINHNIGLTVGNTHRINRFVIDYGIYGNIGLSSVLNFGPSGSNSMEYSNLANMGGYIGLRYVL